MMQIAGRILSDLSGVTGRRAGILELQPSDPLVLERAPFLSLQFVSNMLSDPDFFLFRISNRRTNCGVKHFPSFHVLPFACLTGLPLSSRPRPVATCSSKCCARPDSLTSLRLLFALCARLFRRNAPHLT